MKQLLKIQKDFLRICNKYFMVFILKRFIIQTTFIIDYLYKFYIMSSQRESHARLSFDDFNNKAEDIYKDMFQLSYINSGDQTSHIQNTHEYMVIQNKWLSETQFSEIYNLCWSLPGPTTMQIIITIITLKLKSLSTAINGILVYNLLPWAILTILGILSNTFLNGNQKQYPLQYRMILIGFSAAGAGIMVRSFFTYFTQSAGNFPKLTLILLSALIFHQYRSQNAIIFCLTMGGVVSLYLQIDSQVRKKMSSKSSDMFSKLPFNFFLGKPALIILVSIFKILWIYFSIYPDHHYQYIFKFYFVGCLIIGPIQVIFAYFLSILLQYPTINITQMWIGFSMSFLIPGSHLNIDGILGGVLAALFLYIPCFLFLLGMLPQWKHYRQKGGIKKMYEGLVCSTTGLTLATIIIIMEHCIELDIACSICIFIICAATNCFMSRYAFMTILIGGALGYARYIALYCYKLGTHCPGPFNF